MQNIYISFSAIVLSNVIPHFKHSNRDFALKIRSYMALKFTTDLLYILFKSHKMSLSCVVIVNFVIYIISLYARHTPVSGNVHTEVAHWIVKKT